MQSKIRLFLAAPPQLLSNGKNTPFPLISMAYRLGRGGHLYRSGPRHSLPVCLMGIDDPAFDGRGDPAQFCREVLQECSTCQFDGILCNFEKPTGLFYREALQLLDRHCSRRKLRLWVTEPFGAFAPGGSVMISSAISGGTFAWRLQDAIHRFGRDRVVLALKRTAVDFPLPAPNGAGYPLSQKELKRKLTCHSPTIFFSQALCAQYFVYQDTQNAPRFVLFDDAPSFRKKLQIARSLGLTAAVAAYPQAGDWMNDLLGWEEISS